MNIDLTGQEMVVGKSGTNLSYQLVRGLRF